MKKRYIVSINGNATAQEDERFSAYLKEKGVGWWHWLSNTWLVVDSLENISAKDLRDKAIEIYEGKNNLVLEISAGGVWFGYGPTAPNKDMFKWIKENWE